MGDVILVCVGQCGITLGAEWMRHVGPDDLPAFVHHADGSLRAVFVDSEPKVIRRVARDAGKLFPSVSSHNFIHGRTGFGANWALGYNGLHYRPKSANTPPEATLRERTMECLRQEAERYLRTLPSGSAAS